jgi:hypothetical protein
MVRHKDLEFHVSAPRIFGAPAMMVFPTFGEAATHAIGLSEGRPVQIDVVAWSEDAAHEWAGDHGVEVYREDPEASVHERIIIRAESQGRIA